MQDLNELQQALLGEIAAIGDLKALEALRVGALGKKGRVTELMKALGALAPEERKAAGQALNAVKDAVAAARGAARRAGGGGAERAARRAERIDVTLPAAAAADGRLHPISQTIDEMVAIFGEMGFAWAEGPDIEDDFHNFTALNIPENHPARDDTDTFYLRRRMAAAGAAHPHLAGADPHHGEPEAADPGDHPRARPIAATTTPPTRRCSTRSRGW